MAILFTFVGYALVILISRLPMPPSKLDLLFERMPSDSTTEEA